MRFCLTSQQQLRSYGDGALAYILIQQTGGAIDPTQDPWVHDKWCIHYTTVTPIKR